MRTVTTAAIALLALLAASACASYKAARPVVVCGVTVAGGGPGVGMYDLTEPEDLPTANPGPYQLDDSLIRVSNSCKHGGDVDISPAGSVVMTPVARAKDGKPVVFGLVAKANQATVTITATIGHHQEVLPLVVNGAHFSPTPTATGSSTAGESSS